MPRTVTLLFIRRNLFTWNSAGGLTGYWRVEFSSKTCRICQRPGSFATPAGFTRIKPNPVDGIDIMKMSIRSGQNLFFVLTGEKCWMDEGQHKVTAGLFVENDYTKLKN